MKKIAVGEIRRIGVEVYSTTGADFEIDSAEYAVVNTVGETIKTGVPRIEDKKITMLFNGAEIPTGQYNVIFTVSIADETLKFKVFVEVGKL